jgi:hypothetical protein
MPTPKVSTSYKQEKKNESEMMRSWMSYRWLLKEDIRNGDEYRLRGRLDSMRSEATTIGVTLSYHDEFVQRHLAELIQEVERERRGRKQG